MPKHLCTLGMFIIDEFEYHDSEGIPLPPTINPQIGGGTYTAIGARMFLDASQIGMVVDRGVDFPEEMLHELYSLGKEMWFFRDHNGPTTRALNKYTRGMEVSSLTSFDYLTPRIRITPNDLQRFPEYSGPSQLHFICSPSRATEIVKEINEIENWTPFIIYEPVPYSCVPEELPLLMNVLPSIAVLSPNAEEALSLLAMPGPPARESIEHACSQLLSLGVGENGCGHVIIRSGPLGAYVGSRGREGIWVDAFWQESDREKIVDVTGAGNAFLGGLSAGLLFTNGDVYKAALYASVSASFVIEHYGLPHPTGLGSWNHSEPQRRLRELQARMAAR